MHRSMIYVIAIGAFQAFTAILLLWKSKLRSKADSLLMLLLFCIAAHLAIKFYIYNFVQDGHVRTQMNTFIGSCYGPLLYLYALKNKDAHFIPASRWYVFLPFIAGCVGYLTVVCVLAFSDPAGYAVLYIYNSITTWLFIGSSTFFAWLAIQTAWRHLTAQPQERQLILHVGYCLLTLSGIAIVFSLITSVQDPVMNQLCRSIVYSILILTSIIIIRHKYAGGMAAQVEIPVSTSIVPQAAQTEEQAVPKKMQLSADVHQQIWERLEKHLRETRLFTDAELNLDKLAQSISISKHHLSETLNSYAHKPFYQYINEWRIEHAIEQMHRLTTMGLPVNVLTLAYDCGFKAKSSFNQYFKKITGATPTEYYKSIGTGVERAR